MVVWVDDIHAISNILRIYVLHRIWYFEEIRFIIQHSAKLGI